MSLIVLIYITDRLNIPGLPFEEKYKDLIGQFIRDLIYIETEYNESKEDPPTARNLPPISGKIAWARQLYRRISGPVEVFQNNQELMALPETKKAIKKYNRLARVLVEYELIFVQVWSREIDNARASLNSTVLVRDPSTKELHVNFDQKVVEILRDIQVMKSMGIEVPALGLTVYDQKFAIMEKYNAVNVSVCNDYYTCTHGTSYIHVFITSWTVMLILRFSIV